MHGLTSRRLGVALTSAALYFALLAVKEHAVQTEPAAPSPFGGAPQGTV